MNLHSSPMSHIRRTLLPALLLPRTLLPTPHICHPGPGWPSLLPDLKPHKISLENSFSRSVSTCLSIFTSPIACPSPPARVPQTLPSPAAPHELPRSPAQAQAGLCRLPGLPCSFTLHASCAKEVARSLVSGSRDGSQVFTVAGARARPRQLPSDKLFEEELLSQRVCDFLGSR